jgi:SecD/SecF fusion protein
LQQRAPWFIILVLALVGLSVWINLAFPARLGLDIDGGIRFTILADKSRLPATERTGTNWDSKAKQVVSILEGRANQSLGVAEANVYRKGTDRFIIELPGFQSETEARDIITTSARLDYMHAINVSTALDANRPYQEFSALDAEGREEARFKRRGRSDEEYLKPGTPDYKRMMERWELIAKGEDLASATPQLVGNGIYYLSLVFKPSGVNTFNEFLRKYPGRQENIAAVLDGKVVSFARVMQDFTQIVGDGVKLEGSFTAEAAKRLAGLLNAGALPVDLREENVTKVLPSVGKQALSQILLAGAISFGIIATFLLAYYVFPGLVALLALLAYTSLCYAVFKWAGVTFSLAAIAGFILSIGMAVDANILIFERLKEELRHGRTLLTSIDLGFKRAFPAILDSNACTVITCLVLSNIGTGPVEGFAKTLMIGVAISLFTAVTVTRSLLLFFVGVGVGKNERLYGVGRGWFGERLEAEANERPLHIVAKMGRYFLISLLIILPGLVYIAMGGIRPNVEFLGGVESVVRLPKTVTPTSGAVNDMLAKAGFRGANAKIGDPESGSDRPLAYITVPPADNPDVQKYFDLAKQDPDVAATELSKLRMDLGKRIVAAVGGDSTVVEETRPDGTKFVAGIKDEASFESTGPAVREETIRGAVLGVVLSSIFIVVYLALRFGVALGGFRVGLRFGISAIIAMLHDVLVIIGLSAIAGKMFNWEVSQLTITAMLTVIGFSVHDTIVIFDRIRENLRRPLAGETFDNLVDRSITQSFARSLNTSGTVIVTLAILLFVGSATPDLKHFNAAMLVGILSGTYSSIFNAAPILVLWERFVAKTRGVGATIMHDTRLREPEPPKPKPASDDDDYKPPAGYGQTKRKR